VLAQQLGSCSRGFGSHINQVKHARVLAIAPSVGQVDISVLSMCVVVTEYAPAKLNLSLRVLGRRADGYHFIESLMVPISLSDRVRVSFSETSGMGLRVRLSVRGATCGVPLGRRNLADRAARAFLNAAGVGGDVSIVLHKVIPPASGLGGSSSDAGAVLRFLRCRAARVSGIGEIVRPFHGKVPTWFVVAVPRPGVSTAAAYRRLALTRNRGGSTLATFRYGVSYPVNDLENVVIPRRSDIGRLKGCLLEAGAQRALMSGSGSAVFGVFSSRKRAATAAVRIPHGVRVFIVRSLATASALGRRAGR
jgi:4-diphosphocytidyl-2-C-methyl-D-erythritol kinase